MPRKLSSFRGISYAFLLYFLANFWQFVHSAHTTRADIDCAHSTTNFDMTTLYIEYEAAARAALREADIIAMHWLALTDFTTT